MGVAGAAYAAVFAQAFSVILSVLIICRRRRSRKAVRLYYAGTFRLYAGHVCFCSSEYGSAKAGTGKKALFYGIASSVTAGLIMVYLSFFHGNILAGLFSGDQAVIAAAAERCLL